LVVGDLACPDLTLREVGYSASGQRYTSTAHPLNAADSSKPRTDITTSDVLLVSGGGRGITPLCMASLAQRMGGGTYVLMGRSALSDEPAWAQGVTDTGKPLEKAALGFLKAEFAAGRGAKPTPRALNKLVGACKGNREVRESITLIESRGGRAIYCACDANEEAQVKATLATVRDKYKLTVTGIVHAAGIVLDKRVENKKGEDFDAVFGTKITGLTNLFNCLGDSGRKNLRHLVVFSSLAGFWGNVGQTDYAMANDALSKMIHCFGASVPTCSVRALCFGPWDGGMVTPELKAHFKAQGVQIIPRDEGADQVAAMISMVGADRSQCLIGNWVDPAKSGGAPVPKTARIAPTAATAAPDPEPEMLSGSGFGAKGSDLQAEIDYQREQAKKYKASGKPLLWDFDDLLEYAEGNIAPVFNKHLSGEHPPWELIDTYDKCCRLPMREYLLCSRSPQHNQTAAPANLRQGRCMAGLLLLLSVPCSRI
jgi:NADP-dependent 3-hydroxy acid dehydrogenase YdfG